MPLNPSIVSVVGRTPLIKLNRIAAGLDATIALKAEFFNPLGSVKDRIGFAMIDAPNAMGGLLRPRRLLSRPAEIRASRWPSWPPPGVTNSS